MKKSIFLFVIGFIGGLVSGFFGAGGGMILVPALTLILKEDEISSRATTILCILFFTIASMFVYFNKDSVDLMLALKCISGGIIGSIIGSKLLVKLNKSILQITFIIFLIYSGVRMIL